MKVPMPSGTFPTGIAVFMVYQKTGANNTFDMGLDRSAGGTPSPFNSRTSDPSETYRFIGGAGGFPSTPVETSTNLWRRTTPTVLFMGIFSNTPTTWNESINGVFTTYTTSPTTYVDGADGIYIGARSDFSTVMRGNISEIIAYKVSSITSQERQQVEAYLAWKWGLVGNLPTAHPYRTAPLFTRPFIPLDVSGCSLWFDADDNRTLTLSGSNVTQWNDKSGNGHTATASGAARPTYSSSSRYLLFNGTSNALTLSTGALPSGNSAYSIFIVAYTVNAANPQWILSAGVEATNQLLGVFFFTTNAVWHSWYINEYAVNNSITNGVPSIINVNYSTTRTTITNGGTPTTNNPNATRNNSTSGHFIGRLPTAEVQFLNGGIGEIVIFSREISTGERQQVENYLAEKWNLRPSLSTANPLRLYRALSPVFNPTLIPNCGLWLDAADMSTLTFSGSNVTAWRDKSGLGYSASNIGTITTTTRNNTNVLSMGSNRMSISNFSQRVYSTTFMVGRAAAGNLLVALGQYSTYVFSGNNSLYQLPGDFQFRDSVIPLGTPVVLINQYFVFAIGYNGGSNASFYSINGVPRTTAPRAGSVSDEVMTSTLNINGNQFTGADSSDFCELVVFNQALNAQQARQVEAYLAKKWNIALPSNHPYYSTPV
jgi:hypothetical protein